MKRMRVLLFITLLFVTISDAFGEVDSNSIFLQARQPASVLDVQLSALSRSWYHIYVKEPSASTVEDYPLIPKTGTVVSFSYDREQDAITAEAYIHNVDSFIGLSVADKKKLLKSVLDVSLSHLYNIRITDKKSGKIEWENHMSLRYLELWIQVGNLKENEKGENIFWILPAKKRHHGQAAFYEGKFIYSEPYYLNLQVNQQDQVKAGDKSKFVIDIYDKKY